MDAGLPSFGNTLLFSDGTPVLQEGRWVVGLEEGANKRRPFFTFRDEVVEEEYYEHFAGKKRRLSPQQVRVLERSFESEKKMEAKRKSELARELGLQPRQVAIWFQNRRARWKTEQLEADFHRLNASYDALLADHRALLDHNHRLHAQVTALTEKLQEKELAAYAKELIKPGDQLASCPLKEQLGTGGDGSAVADEDVPQLVNSSADSYFQDNCFIGPIDYAVQIEDDDGNDDAAVQLDWWVWS